MRKLWTALLALSLLLTACGGGGAGGSPSGQQEGVAAFADDLGREVRLEPPRRVAALIGSFADVWHLAGGEETLVAAAGDAWTLFELNLPPETVNLGGVKEIDLERLIAAQPDFVLASANTAAQADLLPALEEMGIPTAYFKVTTFEDYLELLELCTRLTGCPDNYRKYGEDIRAQVERARARADGSAPAVLYVRATGAGCKVKNSRDSVLGEMLADLGCVNIADSDTGLLEELSMEAILRRDPEHIFVVIQGSDPSGGQAILEQTLLNDPAWESLTAVREGRFHLMEDELYNQKPNARWGEAYEKLADILYPPEEK